MENDINRVLAFITLLNDEKEMLPPRRRVEGRQMIFGNGKVLRLNPITIKVPQPTYHVE